MHCSSEGGVQKGKQKGFQAGKKESYHTNLPSTRSWLTCHSITAILWSCPRLSLPLCCQQPSSDALQWKIRHLIKKTSAVACWATCRPILITLHHGKSSFISKNSNLTDIKTRIRFFPSFFFPPRLSEGIGETRQRSLSIMCTPVQHLASRRLAALLGYADFSLFAFFSVVYCLTWFVVSSARKKGGERNCSELVSPQQGHTSCVDAVGAWFRCRENTHMCARTTTCSHTQTHVCAAHRWVPLGTQR